MNKILTVSIAAYNAEKDIERCLDSLINSGKIEKLENLKVLCLKVLDNVLFSISRIKVFFSKT